MFIPKFEKSIKFEFESHHLSYFSFRNSFIFIHCDHEGLKWSLRYTTH